MLKTGLIDHKNIFMLAISVFQFCFVKIKLHHAYSDKPKYEILLQVEDLLVYGQSSC